MSTQSQILKFGAMVLQNFPEMPEDIMQGWIENPKGLQKFLSGLCPPATEWKVWKTIRLGIGPKTADDFRKAINVGGMKTSDLASDILSNVVVTEEIEVDLVVVSVAKLGFKEGATREQICARAKERGLELCPAEVGPQLRLQYTEQPFSEWLVIGMEPIRSLRADLRLFGVERLGGGLWLLSYYDDSDGVWCAGSRFVFVRPRK